MTNTDPKYYKNETGKDLFDEFEDGMMSLEMTKGFYIGNIIKYIKRYPYKNGEEDISKAQVYLNRLAKFVDMDESEFEKLEQLTFDCRRDYKEMEKSHKITLSKFQELADKENFHDECNQSIINESNHTASDKEILGAISGVVKEWFDNPIIDNNTDNKAIEMFKSIKKENNLSSIFNFTKDCFWVGLLDTYLTDAFTYDGNEFKGTALNDFLKEADLGDD